MLFGRTLKYIRFCIFRKSARRRGGGIQTNCTKLQFNKSGHQSCDIRSILSIQVSNSRVVGNVTMDDQTRPGGFCPHGVPVGFAWPSLLLRFGKHSLCGYPKGNVDHGISSSVQALKVRRIKRIQVVRGLVASSTTKCGTPRPLHRRYLGIVRLIYEKCDCCWSWAVWAHCS